VAEVIEELGGRVMLEELAEKLDANEHELGSTSS
jgi:hypothetical protein